MLKKTVLNKTVHFLMSEDGNTSIEYALIAFVMAMAITSTLPDLAKEMAAMYQTLINAF